MNQRLILLLAMLLMSTSVAADYVEDDSNSAAEVLRGAWGILGFFALIHEKAPWYLFVQLNPWLCWGIYVAVLAAIQIAYF